MQSFVFQISGISALLVLLGQLWRFASLERSLVVTVGVGVAVYSVLLVGQAVVRHVVVAVAERDDEALPVDAPTDDSTDSSAEPDPTEPSIEASSQP